MHAIHATQSQVRNAQVSDRFVLLDFVRSIAIVLLLLAHIGQTVGSPLGRSFGIPDFYYVSTGGLAVTIFLVLSGLALELNYRERNVSYCYFITGRVLRIYPVYYLSLLVGLIASAVVSLANSLSMSVPHVLSPHTFDTISSELSPGLVLGMITGLQALWGGGDGPLVSTSWFIGLIMSMYLIYPLISRSIRSHPHIVVIILFGASVLSRALLGQYDVLPGLPLKWFPLCRIFEFGLGIYLATIIAPSFWSCINGYKKLSSIVKFISEISLSLFLVHYPLLFIIKYLMALGLNVSVAVCLYLGVSIFVSWLVFRLANKVPRERILAKISGY